MRHGDVATITFRIVQVNQNETLTYYDRMADLDEHDESGTAFDPASMGTLTNNLRVQWGDFCDSNANGSTRSNQTVSQIFTPNPENLNVDIPHPLYIIRDEGTTPVTVNIWNSGGHTASDYLFYVTFGEAIIVEGPPAQCQLADGNPPHLPADMNVPNQTDAQIPLWNTPAWRNDPTPNDDGNPLPENANVYLCDLGQLGGGYSSNNPNTSLEFLVSKNHSAGADDLTMRADIVGMITLAEQGRDYSDPANYAISDEALVYPPPANLNDPVNGTTPSQQLANNYTLDAVRAKALGFNLLKRYVPGTCKEAANRGGGDGDGRISPPQILIGEECEFDIYAGGWFGFETPGWNVTVDSIAVADAIPAHAGGDDSGTGPQHYVSKEELTSLCTVGGLPGSPNSVCDSVITPGGFTPAAPLGGGNLNWTFGGTSVTTKNRWFLANMTTRLRNESEDAVADPNQHANISVDYGRSRFQVTFAEQGGGIIDQQTIANDGSGSPAQNACFKSGEDWDNPVYDTQNQGCNPSYPGYPQWQEWTAQTQMAEPRLSITKEVCNLSGAAGDVNACQWDTSAEGSKFDDFVYRLTVENEAAADDVARAPAYDVVITDVLDDGGQMCVWAVNGAFDDDGIDNIPGDAAGPQAGIVGTATGRADYTYDHTDPESSPHCLNGGSPAHITFSYEESDKLKQIDPGSEVVLQYRVSPHRTVAPGQSFTNVADIFRYDSLRGESGEQTVVPIPNTNHPLASTGLPETPDTPRSAGARIYCVNSDDESEHCASDSATMTIYEVDVDPIEAIGQSTLGEYAPRQGELEAVVGEEIRLRLTGRVPAARLGDFTFHAELPDGLRCIDAEAKDLRSIDGTTWFPGDSSAPLTPQISGCEGAGDSVTWEYGFQHLLEYDRAMYSDGLIPVRVSFVVRVENNNFTGHGSDLVVNGNGDSYMSYLPAGSSENESNVFVPPPITVHVNGPRVVLEKTFDEAVENVDGDDIVTVTVRATNNSNEDGDTSGTAYGLRVLDDLRNTKYRYVPGSEAGLNGTPAPLVDTNEQDAPIFYWDDPNPDAPAGTEWASPYAIAQGQPVEFSFQVRVVGENDDGVDVSPHEELANTIEAVWQSLPNRNLNLNIDPALSAGAIGADGAEDGMRNGWFSIDDGDPNPVAGINDYDTEAEDSIVVPGLELGKTDVTDTSQYSVEADSRAIGAHRKFELEISLPEGVTDNVLVTDTLSAGYVLADNDAQGYGIRCEYDDSILTINGEAPEEFCESFRGDHPVAGSTGDIAWDIGMVATHTEDDITGTGTIDPVIRITYFARIANVDGNQAGTELSNAANLEYDNGQDSSRESRTAEAGPIAVTEPVLTVTKTASAESAVSGDALDYTVEITNATGDNVSTAFDVNIADILPVPEQLRLDGATINDADSPPGVRDSDGALVWGRENGDNNLDIAPGETLTLVYHTTVLSAFGSAIDNTVYVDWTSLDHGVPGQDTYPGDYQRHGQGCPATTAPNIYCNEASESVTTEDNTVFSKTAESTAWGDPSRARIGDTVQYTLNLGLQPGTTSNVVVTDQLPVGLELVSVESIDCGVNGFTCDQEPIEPAPGATALEWQLGNITAESDSTPPFTIVYTAVVLDDISAFPAGSGEIERINSAELTYDGIDEPREDQASIWVVQPNISDLAKTDTRNSVASPYSVTDIANEVMNFRLQACNTGGAPAYDPVVTDTLNADPANPEFDESTIAIQQVLIGGQPATYSHTVTNGVIEFTFDGVLAETGQPGDCLSIEYNVGLHTDIPSGHTWYNSFHPSSYASLEDEGVVNRRLYGTDVAPQCSAGLPNCFELLTPVAEAGPLTLALESPDDGLAPIGESVSYRIRVPGNPITSSTLADVEVENVLAGLGTLVQIDTVTVNGTAATPAQNGETLTFDIGDIPPNETRDIVVNAWVDNVPEAQSGVTIDTSALYTYSEAGATREMEGEAAQVTIVEPELVLAKAAVNQSGNTEPVAGDIYHFTLEFSEQGANGATAHDLSILEELSLGWVYEPGTTTFNGTAIDDGLFTVTGDGVNEAQTLAWNAVAGTDIPAGESRTLAFDVRVLDSVLAGQELGGDTTAQWTSQQGDAQYIERNGSDMPDANALNNYFLGPQSLPPLAVGNNSTLTKSALSETAPLGDGELRIGDLVTYELRLGAQRGTLPDAVITDTLPQGMVFVDTVSISAEGMDYSLAQEPQPEASGAVSWDLGELVNTSGEELVITYRTRVQRDVLELNAPTIPLPNSAAFEFRTAAGSDSVLSEEVSLDLLQPDLDFALTATPDGTDALTPDETITFTATITNDGTAPAYDIVLRDVIPAGLRQGGVQTISVDGDTTNPLQPTFDATSGETVWNFLNEIPAGGTMEVVYQVNADSDIAAGLQISNNAYVEWYYSFGESDIPEGAALENRQPYGPSDPVSVAFSTPDAQPLLIAVEPASRETASIGEPFVYRITVPAAGALHDVAIEMDLADSGLDPVDLAFVGAEQVSGNIAFNPQGSVDGGLLTIQDPASGIDVEAGDEAVIDVTLMLRDTATNEYGNSFTSRASYSYNYADDNPDAGRGTGEVSEYSAPITIVEPYELALTKTGDTEVQTGLPGNFSLNVENRGDGPAWDITIVDLLPNNDPGGMCETAPDNFTAQIIDAGGNASNLSEGTDFSVAFNGDDCRFTVTTTGSSAALPAGATLQVQYQAWLDTDTVDGDVLTNVAGVTNWWSWDSAGVESREYTRSEPDDGADLHEDALEITALVPSVAFTKELLSDSPASPGDTASYRLTLTNESDLQIDDIAITDELGRLNELPLFEPGTLANIVVSGATDNSDPSGGAHNSGLLDLGDLSLAPNGSLEVTYDVTLAAVIDNGTVVLNQAQVQLPGQLLQDSDDPTIDGDSNPTELLIESAPEVIVEKTSEDITGDPELLMVGDTLRYTLRLENIGDENTIESVLRDQVPANTTYVPNSTTLNGAAVADSGGSTALASGMPVQSPGADEGVLLADPEVGGGLAALVTFDVTINDVNDGTVISNQGFANGEGAGSGAFDEVPSDDPATDAPLDPTIDIVGDVPLLIVQKTVDIAEDNVSAGIVDPGDVLRYTITVTNMGGVDATDAVLTDQLPAYTTYVANSTVLNGVAVADNGGGTSRLDAGLPIASSDLTPPLPGAGEGVITSAQAATITFDVRVDDGTPTGTVISNQGSVSTGELPLTLTDADGNPSNGAQPTEVVVGDAQQLSITKEVAVVGGGAAEAGATLEYLVKVTNISAVPATYVTITDDLLLAGEGVLTYVEDSALLNGQADGITVAGSVITADFAGTFGELQPDDTTTLRFQAKLGENLEIGYRVLNTAEVTWNDPPATEQASVAIDVGGTPGIANLNGYLWHDVNFNDQRDAEERLLQNWSVELYFNNALLETLQSDEDGFFQFNGLVPNMAGGASYELRYVAPNAGETSASLGNASSDFTNGPQEITEIYVGSGANPQNLNLPITPNGVIYDSVLRQPVSGATVTMLRASSGQELPDRCFDDDRQQGQVTRAGGYYKFDINFSEAACAANNDYLIRVEMPRDDYVTGESQIIPPQTNVETAGFDVAACLGGADDLIGATPDHCEVQLSEQAPGVDIDARSEATDYYLRLRLDDGLIPGESQLFNNHIPVDPQLEGALSITKTAALLNVTRSQLVPYTITFSNTLPVPMRDLRLMDFFPAGFKYVAGSAQIDGVATEPEINGLQMRWSDLDVEPDQTRTVKMLLVVGSGVGEGKYINRARMYNQLSGQQASGEASATVRVVPDPTFDCSDVIGKVYDDKNMNGYQDAGEGGVPGARVVTATGLNATTDAHGRFHITCAVVPNQDRGSNFIMKLDDRSLPSGYRLTSENPRVVRATRGKAIKVNFGTSLHRVVRLDMAEAVFEPQTTELRPQWHSRTELLLEKLSEAPSVLRLSYLAENEDPALVERRLQAMKARIADEWANNYGDYELTIETEVFWRRGAPPSEGGLE
ncbi:hypothetical protein [Microbulbifer litoralis]|uniref:hypothetical protein n=1 Tax=Microbulbifer litoralis TaxID=2933965 RepID=UPI002028A747|nr:hypothetical protein [Microbulbifer sp. GX H0434]